jgi:hypothetical protein
MQPRVCGCWLAASVTVALGGAPAAAQSAADTAEVAAAVAGVIGDSVVARLRARDRPFLGEPTTRFDRWVTRRLQETHQLDLLESGADTADWVVTRGFAVGGDSASVIVEVGTRTKPREGIDTYIETHRYLFVRTREGWRYVRRVFVSGADLGAVRG